MRMRPDEDVGYFKYRAMTERALSAESLSPAVARIHLSLAEAYDDLAREHDRTSAAVIADFRRRSN
jgi:hypothetical protein